MVFSCYFQLKKVNKTRQQVKPLFTATRHGHTVVEFEKNKLYFCHQVLMWEKVSNHQAHLSPLDFMRENIIKRSLKLFDTCSHKK